MDASHLRHQIDARDICSSIPLRQRARAVTLTLKGITTDMLANATVGSSGIRNAAVVLNSKSQLNSKHPFAMHMNGEPAIMAICTLDQPAPVGLFQIGVQHCLWLTCR